MEQNPLLTLEIDILLLLLLASLAAITLTRVRFPYTVGLVLLGLLLGSLANQAPGFEIIKTLNLSHDLILFVFVPPLIFESAINLDGRLLWRNLSPVLVLAAPGLLISTVIVGGIVAWGTPLSLGQAVLFGSLISATDPVAVIALFKELGAPKQLSVLVEGESLFNDATAIVTFNIILALVMSGETFSSPVLLDGGLRFAASFMGGLVVGAVLGYQAQFVLRWAKDTPLVLATLSLVVSYGAFIVAEEAFGVSGVIAVVSSGLVIGWFKNIYLTPEVRKFGDEFWEYVAFLANSLIFLLVGITAAGFQIFAQFSQAKTLLGSLGITLVAILLARAMVVFGLTLLVNAVQRQNRIGWRFQVVSFWGGLRGAVCLALALSFDPQFPNRDFIVLLTLGVALSTLLLPGTTIAWLLHRLSLDQPSVFDQIQLALGNILARQTAMKRMAEAQLHEEIVVPELLEQLQQEYQQALEHAQQHLQELAVELKVDNRKAQELLWLVALSAEKTLYRRAYDLGLFSPQVLDQMNVLISLKTDAVKQGQIPPEPVAMDPLEFRLQTLRYRLMERFLPHNVWLRKERSRLRIAQYTYYVVVFYAAEQIPEKMQQIAESCNIPTALLNNCLTAYQQERTEALAELKRIAAETPEAAKEFQRLALERTARNAQVKLLQDLVEEGILSSELASSLT